MARILIFSSDIRATETWIPWLEKDHDVTNIRTEESLIPVILSWQPEVLLYFEKKINEKVIEKIRDNFNSQTLGIIFVAAQYNLREEVLAFKSGVDHYLLFSTPHHSINVRIESLAKRISKRNISPHFEENLLISLPQRIEKIKYGELVFYPLQNLVQFQSKSIRIPPAQSKLLNALLTHQEELLSREWFRGVLFKGSNISLRSIDAHISKLKRNIPLLEGQILNIYGKGYTLKAAETKAS
jgi:DNA-binding response OmpR family regulator